MLEILNNLSPDKISDKDFLFLVDVRTPEEFNSGSVDGAINIPLSVLEQELSQFKNKENIIVFCRSGARSGNAQIILQQHGFRSEERRVGKECRSRWCTYD